MRRFLALAVLFGGGIALAHQQGVLPPPTQLLESTTAWVVRPEPPVRVSHRPTAQASASTQSLALPAIPAAALPTALASAQPEAIPAVVASTQAAVVSSAIAISSAIVAPPEPPPEPEEELPSEPEEIPKRGPTLLATYKETWVYSKPNFKAQKLGYLRAGARVDRGEKPVTRAGCEGGWYRVEPKGFVCVGSAASLELEHPVASMAVRRPDRSKGLPYLYGMSRFPTPPFYLKLPSAQEQKSVESDLALHLQRYVRSGAWVPDELDGVPPELLRSGTVPSLTPRKYGTSPLFSGRAIPRSGFAMVSQFEWEGRRWGLTTDFQIVPIDRMRLLQPSDFHGVKLQDGGLPVAFNRSKGGRIYRRNPETKQISEDGPLSYRQGLELTGKRENFGGVAFLELRDGRWIRDNALLRLDLPREWPSFALQGKRWIDVSILKQSLVAYEGTKPVYATMVSTGADGLGDPEKTHSTVRGVFMIHTKHITATMDSDEGEGDQFDLRDVPYVQYFERGYALHAAYWHDDFGRPRSHGCINLHPTDAAWLFGWTTPDVPADWHGALTLRGGTLVYIHP